MNDYILKPLIPAQLVATLERRPSWVFLKWRLTRANELKTFTLIIQNIKFDGCAFVGLVSVCILAAAWADPVVELDEFRVTASLMVRLVEDFAQPAEVLSGAALGQRLTASIGETLAGLPGVASTQSFPGASRPVSAGIRMTASVCSRTVWT